LFERDFVKISATAENLKVKFFFLISKTPLHLRAKLNFNIPKITTFI